MGSEMCIRDRFLVGYTILSFLPAINDSLTFINGHIHKRLCPAQVPWPSTKLWEVGCCTGHRTKRSPIQTGRCLFAVASFMLALIGLKKFRSFQKPNRLARTFDAFGGRRDTKQGVSGPAPEWRGVSRSCGSSGTAPEPVWGPRGAFWAYKRTRSG